MTDVSERGLQESRAGGTDDRHAKQRRDAEEEKIFADVGSAKD